MFNIIIFYIILINYNIIDSLTEARECESINIFNDCENFKYLNNCTVVKGYVTIVLLPRNYPNKTQDCHFDQLRFPALREITDYFIFYDVKGLKSIRNMFPKLTVIRGRRLFLNYALGISSMPNLEFIEFKSLVAIQRGHVYIGSNPKLCNLQKIHWDRLTLSPGENHIYPVNKEFCPKNGVNCTGCNTEYCWSQLVCQKFENDNVDNPIAGTNHCHDQCLGGCYNTSNNGCVVCKIFTDHGLCVSECPPNKYSMEHFQRCYTVEECVTDMGMFIHELSCVHECPAGFKSNNLSICIECNEHENCTKVCTPDHKDEAIIIYNLADAERYAGCEIVNSSLLITIRNKIDEMALYDKFKHIKEIRGHLKIFRSPHLESLKFLSNLKKVYGQPLENNLYALIIYDNKKLRELWDANNLNLVRGSMYIHLNNKLCNEEVHEFRSKVIHSIDKDTLQINDQEVLCHPLKIMLTTKEITHHSLTIAWRKDQTSDQVEILYRQHITNIHIPEESELDENVCNRINWQRDLKLANELLNNETHFIYTIENLNQNQKYAFFIKTLGEDINRNARSDVLLEITKTDIPFPPLIKLLKKNDTSISFQILQADTDNNVITHYLMELYDIPDDVHDIDIRNYCEEPILLPEDMPLEAYSTTNLNVDYEECCAKNEEETEDRIFSNNMRDKFRCSLDNQQYCHDDTHSSPGEVKPLHSQRLSINQSIYTLYQLQHYHLYILQIKACNNIGCSSYSIHNERTNISDDGDRLTDLQVCHIKSTTIYWVYFTEPQYPNGAITSYMLHFRSPKNSTMYIAHMVCLTRLQHEQAKYQYIGNFNTTFLEAAVRVHSIVGDVMTAWVNITDCSTSIINDIIKVPVNVKSHGINIFLLCFLLGASGTLCWVFYKRRLWTRLNELRRFLPLHWRLHSLMLQSSQISREDRQILVDGFENVRFHNSADDESKYLNLIH